MILKLFSLLRTIIGWIDIVLLWLVCYPLSWLPLKLTRGFYPALFTFWCNTFIRGLNVQLKLHQKNKRPIPEQYIVISNHPSAFEDAGMPALFKARFLAKREVEHWWFVGRIAKAGGTIFFHREDKAARKAAAEDITKALAQGDNIGLYPEGGCKGRRIHLPFHYGIFEISLKTQVPIVPVFLHYESQEDFEWNKQHLLKKIWQILTSQNKTANYYVYDAVYPSQFNNKEEYCEFMQDLYLELQKRYLD